jgi:L-proline amide hydrolase
MHASRRIFIAFISMALVSTANAKPGPEVAGIQVKPDQEAMISVPGGKIYVRVNGDLTGPRAPVIFIHGGPGGSHAGFLNATSLASDRAVILYDQLDSGQSEHPGLPDNWKIPRFLDEIEAIREHFGIERWHVVGSSWGGTLALEYGARYSDPVASVVMQSPLVSTELWLRDADRLKKTMPESVQRLLNGCDTPDFAPEKECAAATAAFYNRYVHLTEASETVRAYRTSLPRPTGPSIYNYMWGRAEFTSTGTLKNYDGRPLLKQLDPRRSLFMAGEFDEATPATVAGFARDAHGSRFAEVKDAAHSAMNDNPAAYFAILKPWLAAHDSPAPGASAVPSE